MTTRVPLLLPLVLHACGEPRVRVLQDKGSDTMVNLMLRMSEAYLEADPTTVVAVTGGGSGTGIKSIIDGTTDLANASRDMTPEELAKARKNGVEPFNTVIAHDGLAVYVSVDNPIPQITFDQLRCIYAAHGGCDRWSDLGVALDCGGTDEIIKLGRQNNSGTYEYFREEVLGKGRFTNTLDQSGTQQVVDVIGTAKCAIGYGGMGYQTDRARFVCLAAHRGDPCSEPNLETVEAGRYTFARALNVYTAGPPEGAVAEFLSFSLSPRGQAVVQAAGFVPVHAHQEPAP